MDRDRLSGSLSVRNRRDGDRIQPLGMTGKRKLQKLLMDHHVPQKERSRVPLICDEQGIIWVAGHCISERVRLSESTRRVVCLSVAAIGQSSDQTIRL